MQLNLYLWYFLHYVSFLLLFFVFYLFSAVMTTLEMPQINILSKMDLFTDDKSFDLEFFTNLPDVTRLLELLNVNFLCFIFL